LGKYRDWNEALNVNGPFDDPSFCFQNGLILVQNAFMRQAVDAFARVRQLAPDYLPARLLLAQIYIFNRLPDRALETLHEPLTQPEKFGLAETNSTELNILAAGAYFQKNDITRGVQLLETEISRHPTNDDLLTATAKAYTMRGLFTNALKVIDRKLKFSPDDPAWILNRGYIYIQLKAYDTAIADLTRVLAIQPNNPDALFSRAVARLGSDKLDGARADYLQLQQTYANSFPVAYGLGEIAWRRHETNEAIRNYVIYLANANTNTAEAKVVHERLDQLQAK
jgi:tetratricopeptide (TPR) repeat protein